VAKGKICVSVCAETADEMLAKIRRAEKFADVVEVRFDCLKSDEINHLLGFLKDVPIETPMIATFRPEHQGGHSSATLDERSDFWRSHHSGFWAADVEEEVFRSAFDWFKTIISFHDFEGVPKHLDRIYDDVRSTGADIIKLAVHADDICDAIPVWKLLEEAKSAHREIVPIAMGEAGKWTRILGLAHGACMTYAALEKGKETALGQISAKDLVEVYRVKDIDLDTRVYGVVGDPVARSFSVYMHNAAFSKENINAVFVPLQIRDLDEFVTRMVKLSTREVELNFAGFAVTMPHKQAIMKHLDEIDPVAGEIGAVNTFKIDNGKLIGYNTDAHGFVTSLLERAIDLNGARVAVFGSGGAARACACALKKKNADVTIFARDESKALQLAEEFDVRAERLMPGLRLGQTDIVVNATPVGMKGLLEKETLLTAEQLDGVRFVYDLVTSGSDTPLIREAKKAGIDAINGIEMLIHQGAQQFEIWTGTAAPIDDMKAVVLERI